MSYQNCYPGCTQCTGPDKNQCIACSGGLIVINGECRCSIRKSVMQSYGCVDKCYLTGSKLKSQNRICLDFVPASLVFSSLYGINLEPGYNWNIIYDPQHLDIIDKKLSPYNFGLFRFREGAYTSISTIFAIYPLVTLVQFVFCNATPINTGVQFYINQTYIDSVYFDGTQFIYDKVEMRSQQTYPVTGQCINNLFISVEIFTTLIQQKLTFSLQGNFTQPGAGWFLRFAQITTGYCPYRCLKCDMFYRCIQCYYGFVKISDGTCLYFDCPLESTYNGNVQMSIFIKQFIFFLWYFKNKFKIFIQMIYTHCVKYDQVTKYSKYIVREFYDFTVTDTLNTTFILESTIPTDLQKGSFVYWSYTDTKRIFGGKYIWAQSRFSQIYIQQKKVILTLINIHYFQLYFKSTSFINYLFLSNFWSKFSDLSYQLLFI